ncbi:MAG: hypothetical protein R2695_13100 [Acidimicrobiales bacterium]
MTSITTSEEGLRDLRRFIRTRRRKAVDVGDFLYRIYVSALLGLFGFYLALGLVDDVAVAQTGSHGPAPRALVDRLAAAVAIALGLRSGNGGPLAIDDLELHHVLLSPVDRSVALAAPRPAARRGGGARGPVRRGRRRARVRRLPGAQLEWVVAGVLGGAPRSACRASAPPSWLRPRPSPPAARRGVAGAAGLGGRRPLARVAHVAHLGVRPARRVATRGPALAAVALVVTAALAGVGWIRRGGLSIERAHHRSQLVAQIRFAFAQQDIRSLLLLRRQLAFETPRRRPWFRVPGGGRVERRFPALVRDARSYARWPLVRILRVGGLAVVAGLSLGAVWHGTTVLVAVAGVALYLASIEVIEPLSQELDHPGMLELIPVTPGHILLEHVAAAATAMTVVWLTVGSVASIATLDWRVGAASAIAAVPGAIAAVGAGGLSIKRFDSPAMVVPPEVEGPRMLYRLLWPPLLATAGALPVLLARSPANDGLPFAPAAVNTAAAGDRARRRGCGVDPVP